MGISTVGVRIRLNRLGLSRSCPERVDREHHHPIGKELILATNARADSIAFFARRRNASSIESLMETRPYRGLALKTPR